MESIIQPLDSTRNRLTTKSGFTLVELLVVISIVAILATLAFGSYAKFKEMARIARCCEEIRSLEREITAYATERGELPPDLAAIHRQDLKDPWGNLYQYFPAVQPVGQDNADPNNRVNSNGTINTDFDLYSLGATSDFDPLISADVSQDDIIRAEDGSFVGLAKDHI